MRGGRSPRNLKSGHSHLNVAQLPPAPGRCWIVLPSLHVANGVDLWETDTEVICINRGCFAFPPFIPPNVWIKPRSDVGKQHRSGGKLFGWQRSLMCTSPIERGLLIMNYEICFFFSRHLAAAKRDLNLQWIRRCISLSDKKSNGHLCAFTISSYFDLLFFALMVLV